MANLLLRFAPSEEPYGLELLLRLAGVQSVFSAEVAPYAASGTSPSALVSTSTATEGPFSLTGGALNLVLSGVSLGTFSDGFGPGAPNQSRR